MTLFSSFYLTLISVLASFNGENPDVVVADNFAVAEVSTVLPGSYIPSKVVIKNCGPSTGQANGTYLKSSNNIDSSCDCWNEASGKNQSLGKYGNDWMIFFYKDCKAVVGSGTAMQLGINSSCDPTSLSCITEPNLVIQGCGPSTAQANGTYVKSSNNIDSSCDCWNDASGKAKSLGKYGNDWMIFFYKDCKAVVGSGTAMQLAVNNSCDPISVPCIRYQ